jgi:hypothetical protein
MAPTKIMTMQGHESAILWAEILKNYNMSKSEALGPSNNNKKFNGLS